MSRLIAILAVGLSAAALVACKPASPSDAGSASQAQAGGAASRLPERQTLDDMLKRTHERFDRVDANHDGRIDTGEMDAALAAAEAAGQAAGGPGPGAQHGGVAMLERADADHDGVVTLSEVEAQTQKRFARLDADHDGVVTREEMRAAFSARRNGGG